MSTEIKVRDIGPVVEFSYTLDQPGLHVLRGRQGAGKTTILRTVQLAIDGRCDVRPGARDGATQGTATVAGRRLLVSKRIREEGLLSVEGLGDLDIGELHSPRFVDAATRDRHRIKTLVRLAGVKADADLFRALLPNPAAFDEIVPPSAVATDDMVEMATLVKRALERAAQEQERREETAKAHMAAQQRLSDGVVKPDLDEAQATQLLRESIEREAALRQRRQAALEVRGRAEQAQRALDGLALGPGVADCQRAVKDAETEIRLAEQQVAELRERLREAEALLREKQSTLDSARQQLAAAERESAMVAAWRKDIEAARGVVCPDPQEIAEAQASIAKAQEALRQIEAWKRAETARAECERHAEDAKRFGQAARRLRQAAQETSTVLTEAVKRIPDCPLRVIETTDGQPRLVLATDRSPTELFDELSDGERWPHIIRLAAASNRLIVLHQQAFGELAPSTRALIDQLAKQHGCYVLTAEVDDGPLRAEPWAP